MKQGFFEEHWIDENGNPAGGVGSGRGIGISWQNGQLGRHLFNCVPPGAADQPPAVCATGCTRREPNGAFVEDVLGMVVGRIEFYENGKFACDSNKLALKHLRLALEALDSRTRDREARKIEGMHEV